MTLHWIRESLAVWDLSKARIVGGAEDGIFDERLAARQEGEIAGGEWWQVRNDQGDILGYGWLDVVWGDAEILLAVAPEHRRQGVGAYILKQLDVEARKRGLNYLYNVVRSTHPHAPEVTRWLEKQGFVASGRERLHRAVVRRAAPLQAQL